MFHDTRPGGTTARGQERGTGGLIRGIQLRESWGVDLANIQILPHHVYPAGADLDIAFTTHNWLKHPSPVTIKTRIQPFNFSDNRTETFQFSWLAKPGDGVVHRRVHLNKPQLWWSWDYGKPNLYVLNAVLQETGHFQHVDTKSVRFGVREIKRDNHLVWYLNGLRIYPRGTNYIATQWLSQADKAWYAKDVSLMKAANLNSVRVHAHLERPEFYDLADETGLMVWQDFPLQWGYTERWPGS